MEICVFYVERKRQSVCHNALVDGVDRMGKVIFLDMDGTLVDLRQRMYPGTWYALQRARANGHKIVLCTARAYTGIYPWLMRMSFDAVVASSGAYVRCGDEVVAHHMLDQEKVRGLTEMLWQQGAATLVQGLYAGYAISGHKEKILDFFRHRNLDGDRILNRVTVVENPSGKAALENVLYFTEKEGFREILQKIPERSDGYFHVMPADFGSTLNHSGIIGRSSITKASAMEELLDYWKIPFGNSMAVGDGADDFDMIRYAAVSIVMGNGIPELKDLADYVTDSVEEGGVANAFRDFGLI